MPATMLAALALVAVAHGAVADVADPEVEGTCDASDPSCAEGLSLRQLRATQRHSQESQAEAAHTHVSFEGATLGGHDLFVSPGKAVLVQGSGLLLGPRADVLRLAEAAGADTGAEEPFPIDCEKVDDLPQLTLSFGQDEALVLPGSHYTARRADGRCVLTAMTLDERGPADADWVVGDFGQLSLAELMREHWFGLSSASGSSILSGSKCSLCQYAMKSKSGNVDTMCKGTCHSYGIPFGCSTICHKLEKHICGSSSESDDTTAACGSALCNYFMPSCSPDGGDADSGSSSWVSSVFGSSTKCYMCQAAFKAEGGQSVDQACMDMCQKKGIPFGCSTICRKLEQKVCGTTGDGSGDPQCGKALCGYFITGCGQDSDSGSS